MVRLEHVNVTVVDPDKTAAMLCSLFDWHVRWQGVAMETGRTVHVGTHDCYVALYTPGQPEVGQGSSHGTQGGLNHIAVVVDDLAVLRGRVAAAGYVPGQEYDYEPGKRFYFREENGIEFELVSYA